MELQGHRGARGLRPENTLPGIAHALAVGVDAVEFDVGLTADGVVVVHHDQTLSALTSVDREPVSPGDPMWPYVGRRIRELTLAQVRTVDSGVRRPDPLDPFTLTQLPLPGTPVATLQEVCRLIRCAPTVRLCVELKTDPSWADAEVAEFTAAVAGVLNEHGLLSRSRLLGFDWRFLKHARRLAPRLGRVALAEPPTLDPQWLAGSDPDRPVASAFAAGATVYSPQYTILDEDVVRESAELGMPVTVWTVNEPEEMERFIRMGVSAIVSDYPDRLRIVAEEQGLALPRRYRTREAVFF
ncbi:glycerophosphodiester phosphodiesterase family protein [Actinocorallia sp. B10E7]|uniref:glycerophosphodiester phosphodiesterase family protein n=1 Tax=Actinocorallia sp. B10E7 TaxID=3153558 RepID=UPI00325ED06C